MLVLELALTESHLIDLLGDDEAASQNPCFNPRSHAPLYGLCAIPRFYVSSASISQLVSVCWPVLFLWGNRASRGSKEKICGHHPLARQRDGDAFSDGH